MRHRVEIRLLLCLSFAALSLGLASCAGVPQPHTGVASADGATPRPSATARPTSRPSATPQSASVPGLVTVTVDKSHYSPTERISVTITSGLTTNIATTDHQTNCMIVTLEHLVSGGWQAVGACRLLTPTRVMPIPPGATAEQLSGSAWGMGTYRIAFHYFTESGAQPAQGATPSQVGSAYSASFIIG